MAIRLNSVKKLRTELAAVGKEIDERIVKLDKLSKEIIQDSCELEDIIEKRQTLCEAKFRKSLLSSGEEVWNYVWEDVWDAVQEYEHQAAAETKPYFRELTPALKARENSLKKQLNLSEMFGEQVWSQVCAAVRKVVRRLKSEYKQTLTAEMRQTEEELSTLLEKQLVMQKEMEELHGAGNKSHRVF